MAHGVRWGQAGGGGGKSVVPFHTASCFTKSYGQQQITAGFSLLIGFSLTVLTVNCTEILISCLLCHYGYQGAAVLPEPVLHQEFSIRCYHSAMQAEQAASVYSTCGSLVKVLFFWLHWQVDS